MEDVLGNRGKCAQPCRLPYELIEEAPSTSVNSHLKQSTIDKGYLLSPRDLCSLGYLPQLISAGVDSFKIEGRMKLPDYVATVTKIYRKYIDLAISNEPYKVSEEDRKNLLQVFNRGGFSSGHLEDDSNRNLIFKDKPNNMGIYVGNISNYNSNKGLIKLQLNEPLSIGDSISIDGETGKYTISELMINDKNVKTAESRSIVRLGRMKGNIKVGSKVYKLASKSLTDEAKLTYTENANFKKIALKCSVEIKAGTPISVSLSSKNVSPFYKNISIKYMSDVIPDIAINNSISKERVINQFSKLGTTPYYIENISVDLDDNVHIPSISVLNDIRRKSISTFMENVFSNSISNRTNLSSLLGLSTAYYKNDEPSINLLLEYINLKFDYSKICGITNIYIPLKFLANKKYYDILTCLSAKFNMYVYMPTILKANYKNLMLNNLDTMVTNFNIKGFVVSNIAGIQFLKKYIPLDKFNIVANYTMNIFNNYTINELAKIGINTTTPSVELNSNRLSDLIDKSILPTELIAYGRTILMNSSYCLLGKTNKCYPDCSMNCSSDNKYYLRDRLGFNFRIIPDNIQTVTSIYNSKITSIDTNKFNVSSLRINILDETIDEINNIITTVKSRKKLVGSEYTNGNLNKEI